MTTSYGASRSKKGIKTELDRLAEDNYRAGMERAKKDMVFAMLANGLTPQQIAGLTSHRVSEIRLYAGVNFDDEGEEFDDDDDIDLW